MMVWKKLGWKEEVFVRIKVEYTQEYAIKN